MQSGAMFVTAVQHASPSHRVIESPSIRPSIHPITPSRPSLSPILQDMIWAPGATPFEAGSSGKLAAAIPATFFWGGGFM
jgi:hypothetical protein